MRIRLFFDSFKSAKFVKIQLPSDMSLRDTSDRDWDFIIPGISSEDLYEWGDENLYKKHRCDREREEGKGIVYTIDDDLFAMLLLRYA